MTQADLDNIARLFNEVKSSPESPEVWDDRGLELYDLFLRHGADLLALARERLTQQSNSPIVTELQTLEAQHTADLNRIDELMKQHAIYERTIAELRNKDKQ